MNYSYSRLAGLTLFVGAVQFLIAMIVAEALYLGYSVRDNYISDLGVGPSALTFNSSIFLLGALIVVGAYFIHRGFGSRLFSILLILSGIGAVGVGLFTENYPVLHFTASLTAFLFGGFAAIASYRLQKAPLSYLAVLLGVATLVALGLFASRIYIDLGAGGMERMIVYPTLL